jgi:hypothetical protein
MILVDTSVWIAHLRGLQTQATAKLEAAAVQEPLLVGDLIPARGSPGRSGRSPRRSRRTRIAPICHRAAFGADLAPRVARNYRTLRDLGVTIRKTADLVIGTFCIQHHHRLLHDDRDFSLMEQHLGLTVL